MANYWTKPYYGVSHLAGTRHGTQVTVTQRSTFAEAFVFAPDIGLHWFTNHTEHMFKTIDEAKAWGIRKAKELGLLRFTN